MLFVKIFKTGTLLTQLKKFSDIFNCLQFPLYSSYSKKLVIRLILHTLGTEFKQLVL